jgi:hypothetical protein
MPMPRAICPSSALSRNGGRHHSGVMGHIARNRHTAGFARILADSLPVASRIASSTCIRRHPGTPELALLGLLGLGLGLGGL